MTTTMRPNPAAAQDGEAAGVRVRLFDSDRTDEDLELEAALERRIGDHQLLWIDVEGPVDPGIDEAIAKRLDLRPATRRSLGQADNPASITLHGSYFHVRVATEADHEPSESPHWLDLVAGGNVVLTKHAEPIAFLRDLDDRVEADTNVGAIDAPAFVATAIDFGDHELLQVGRRYRGRGRAPGPAGAERAARR